MRRRFVSVFLFVLVRQAQAKTFLIHNYSLFDLYRDTGELEGKYQHGKIVS